MYQTWNRKKLLTFSSKNIIFIFKPFKTIGKIKINTNEECAFYKIKKLGILNNKYIIVNSRYNLNVEKRMMSLQFIAYKLIKYVVCTGYNEVM